MENLRQDSLLDIFTKNDTSTPLYVQAHQSKHLSDGANKIRMMINDGKWFLNAIFKPTEHQQSLDGFQKYAILNVTNYSVSGVNGKYFVLLNECKVVEIADKVDTTYQSLDKYLNENPDINLFQKALDALTSSHSNSTSTTTSPAPDTKPSVQQQQHQQQHHQQQSKPSPSSIPPNIKGLTTIDQLSPYHNSWSIKARVSYKGDMRTWSNQRGSGKLFSVNLMDETGEIKATAFNQAADKFYDIFQENQVFYVSKASIQAAKKQWSNLPNDNEISLEKDSIVIPAGDESGVPKMHFNFVKLNQIQNTENNTVVDVLGIIKTVEERKEIVSKSTGKPYDRRDITVVDESQLAINVGLWNKMARDFNLDPGTPVAIKGCKVNDFNGKQLSLIPSALIMPNPDIPEAYKLKGWYDNEGSSESFKSLKTSGGNSDLTSKDSILQRFTISHVHDSKLGFTEKTDYFSIKATVSFVKPEHFSYPSCSMEGCQKKVIEQSDGTWRCEKCNVNLSEPLHRYILTASVIDETGQMWLNLFNDAAEKLVGCSANKLLEIKESSDENLFRNYLQEKVLFKEFAFRIGAQVDNYQGVDRARFRVTSVSPIIPSNESDAIIDILDKLQF